MPEMGLGFIHYDNANLKDLFIYMHTTRKRKSTTLPLPSHTLSSFSNASSSNLCVPLSSSSDTFRDVVPDPTYEHVNFLV